jgi:protein-arginine kinase activator protein McsA
MTISLNYFNMGFKPKEFVVGTSDEFQEMVDSKDFRISESIVEGIFANLTSKKKNIHLLSVVCEEEGSVYDITIEKKHFAETLEENLVHYVREERYEDCQKIADTINVLKKEHLSSIVQTISGSK